MGNSSSTEDTRPESEIVQLGVIPKDPYVPANAKELRDSARTLKHSDPSRKQLFQQAAQVIFEHNNDEHKRSRHEIDLHGLHREEAVEYAEREIRRAKEQSDAYLVFIVGRGLHSINNIAVLKPTINNLLAKYNLSYEDGVPNEGCITVRFETSWALSRSLKSYCTIL